MLTSASVFQSASVTGSTQKQLQPCSKPSTLYATTAHMPKLIAKLLLFLVIISFYSCFVFPQFNESGKESTLRCLYFNTDSNKLVYKCHTQQKIAALTIIDNSKSRTNRVFFEKKFDIPVKEYEFPFSKDSLSSKTFEILISITESHSREGYTIYVKPEDFVSSKKVYCKYSPL